MITKPYAFLKNQHFIETAVNGVVFSECNIQKILQSEIASPLLYSSLY
jgi:hypothetical protein